MALHSLDPGFWKIYYTSNAHQHIQVVPVKPVLTGGVYLFEEKGGNVTDDFATAVAAYAAILKLSLPTTANIDYAEFWRVASPLADPVYEEAVDLNVAGTNVVAVQPLAQVVYTFRTVGGGLYRWYVMEGAQGATTNNKPPFGGTTQTVSNLLIAADSYVAGRDGTYLGSLARALGKINDALRKKYFVDV